jgi:hypothetical protein
VRKPKTLCRRFVMSKSIRDRHPHLRAAHSPDMDDGDAFLRDFRRGFVEARDGDVEAFGEEFIAAATSGHAIAELARNENGDEDFHVLPYESLGQFDPPMLPRRGSAAYRAFLAK